MLGPTRPNQCRGAAWCASSQTFAGQPPIRRGSVFSGWGIMCISKEPRIFQPTVEVFGGQPGA